MPHTPQEATGVKVRVKKAEPLNKYEKMFSTKLGKVCSAGLLRTTTTTTTTTFTAFP